MSCWNASRGLRINETSFEYLDEGAYSVVFVDHSQGRVRKVLKRHDGGKQHCRDVFEAETHAYERAKAIAPLEALVPAYFGQRSGQKIIDGNGDDLSGEFWCDLALETKFIKARFVKIGTILGGEFTRIIHLFQTNGILHISDASVHVEDSKIKTVIDFAMQEHELWTK